MIYITVISIRETNNVAIPSEKTFIQWIVLSTFWNTGTSGFEIKKILRSPFGDQLEKINIVTSCKFLVASIMLYNDAAQSQGFWYFAWSQSLEIHKNTQNNSVEILSNSCLYNIFEAYLNY